MATKNATFKFADMNLFYKSLARITAENWKHSVQHVITKAETKCWQLDHIIEKIIEFLILNVKIATATAVWNQVQDQILNEKILSV